MKKESLVIIKNTCRKYKKTGIFGKIGRIRSMTSYQPSGHAPVIYTYYVEVPDIQNKRQKNGYFVFRDTDLTSLEG